MDKASNSVPCIGYKNCSEFDKGDSGFCSMEKYYDPDSSNHGLFCYRVGGPVRKSVRKFIKEDKMKSSIKLGTNNDIIKVFRDKDLEDTVCIEVSSDSKWVDRIVGDLVLSLVKDGKDVEVFRKPGTTEHHSKK